MRCFDRIAAALLCGLWLAACQYVPVSGPTNPDLAPLPDAPGLTVMPVEGLPPQQAEAVARAMADALAERNIPAATEGANLKTRFVVATARVAAAPQGALRIRVGWRLITRDGKVLGTHRAAATLPRAFWFGHDRKVFRTLTDGAATRFAGLIQSPEIVAAADAPPPERPSLHVWPIEGAPDGANDVLRREMQGALRRHGHVVSETVEQGTLVVSGLVELGPTQSGRRPLSVSWAVLDWRGRELGTLAQSKMVPADDIESGWPRFAVLIAESAADGVEDLLRKSRDRQARGGPVAFTAEGGAGKVRAPRQSYPAPVR